MNEIIWHLLGVSTGVVQGLTETSHIHFVVPHQTLTLWLHSRHSRRKIGMGNRVIKQIMDWEFLITEICWCKASKMGQNGPNIAPIQMPPFVVTGSLVCCTFNLIESYRSKSHSLYRPWWELGHIYRSFFHRSRWPSPPAYVCESIDS